MTRVRGRGGEGAPRRRGGGRRGVRGRERTGGRGGDAPETSRAHEVTDDEIDDVDIDDHHIVTQPGPLDRSLLTQQDNHRSNFIWAGELLYSTLDARHGTLRKWELDPRIVPYVIEAGFWPWSLVQGITCDVAQLTALVERWRPETHTFHLRDGEMTITLQDVGILGGLSIDGLPVTGTEDVSDNWTYLCIQCFGRDLERHSRRRNCVKHSTLISQFLRVPQAATEEEIQRHARAYLLFLVGATLFADGSSSLISLHYLQLIHDLSSVGKYSWGSAALAYLYRSLCVASTDKHVELCGPVVLLQLWA